MQHLGLVQVGVYLEMLRTQSPYQAGVHCLLRGYYQVVFAWHHYCHGCSPSLLQSVERRQWKYLVDRVEPG